MNLSEAIRQVRKHADLTQTRLGEIMGLSQAYISDLERGVTVLSLKACRVSFKSSIASLPFEVQMYLMRHRSPDVTLGNYTAVDDAQVRRMLDSAGI